MRISQLLLIASWLSQISCGLASLYDREKNHVKIIDSLSSFQNDVIDGHGIWMVQFFSPTCPHCQSLVTDYKTVADVARGIFNIAAVDMSTQAGQEIGALYQVQSFPTILLFGDDKKPIKYTGPRSAQDMFQKVMDVAISTLRVRGADGDPTKGTNASGGSGRSGRSGGKSKVVQINSSNFQNEVLDNPLVSAIAFTAPWCGYCKKLQPEWEEAAHRLDGEGAFLGWVDATVDTDLAAIYGVKGYPTIKLFPGGAGKSHSDAREFNGRTTSDIVREVLAEVDRSGVPKEIAELTSEDVLKEHCSGLNHICVLAALPHILDSGAAGRNMYKDMIATVSKTFRGSSFSFLWFEGTAQPDLEQALELTFGFPAVAALSMEKEAYVVMRGSFSEKAITSFLHGVTNGRQRTLKLTTMPKVITVEPWDGLDGKPVEDEIPLCEVMGTCDEEEGEL